MSSEQLMDISTMMRIFPNVNVTMKIGAVSDEDPEIGLVTWADEYAEGDFLTIMVEIEHKNIKESEKDTKDRLAREHVLLRMEEMENGEEAAKKLKEKLDQHQKDVEEQIKKLPYEPLDKLDYIHAPLVPFLQEEFWYAFMTHKGKPEHIIHMAKVYIYVY